MHVDALEAAVILESQKLCQLIVFENMRERVTRLFANLYEPSMSVKLMWT